MSQISKLQANQGDNPRVPDLDLEENSKSRRRQSFWIYDSTRKPDISKFHKFQLLAAEFVYFTK